MSTDLFDPSEATERQTSFWAKVLNSVATSWQQQDEVQHPGGFKQRAKCLVSENKLLFFTGLKYKDLLNSIQKHCWFLEGQFETLLMQISRNFIQTKGWNAERANKRAVWSFVFVHFCRFVPPQRTSWNRRLRSRWRRFVSFSHFTRRHVDGEAANAARLVLPSSCWEPEKESCGKKWQQSVRGKKESSGSTLKY